MNFELITLAKQANALDLKALLPMILIYAVLFGCMYFIFIRPNRKKQKEEQKMRENLQVGDEILTIGGIFGKVVAVKEDSFIVESGPEHSKIRIAKWAIQQNFSVKEPEPKETLKAKKTKKDKENRGEA